MELHLISRNGVKNKSIPTAKVTVEGIFVPNTPEDEGGVIGVDDVVGWGSAIRKISFKILLSLQPNNDN